MTEEQILDANFNKTERKPLSLTLLALTLIGISGFIGATTNLVNGNVSEEYFRKIMGWNFDGIWKAAILQGIVEGLIYGVIFSFIFTIGFAIITKRKADWAFAKKQLKKIVVLIYSCWAIGGILAIILAFTFPEGYDQFIYAVPKETLPRIGYAWVGGSIWGAMIGSLIAIIWGLINTSQAWRKELLQE